MKKKYTVRVDSYDVGGEVVLGFEIPEEFLADMDLRQFEMLEFEVDTDTKVTTINKTMMIASQ